MSEASGQSQRYCGNCGAEVRSGTAFCVSCGAPLASRSGQSGPTSPGSPGRYASLIEDLKTRFQRIFGGLEAAFSGLNTSAIRDVPRRALNWFRDLPGIPKMVIVGLVALILLVVLSPVAMIAAALVLGISIIALVIQVIYKGRLKNWGIAAVASLVLLFTFGGISEAIYGIGFIGGGASSDIGEVGGGPTVVNDDSSSVPPDSSSNPTPPSSPVDISPSSDGVPDYEVVNGQVMGADKGVNLTVTVATEPDFYEQDLGAVIEDIQDQTSGSYDYVTITFVGPTSVGGTAPIAKGYIAHTAFGEQMAQGVPAGSWAIDPIGASF